MAMAAVEYSSSFVPVVLMAVQMSKESCLLLHGENWCSLLETTSVGKKMQSQIITHWVACDSTADM